MKTGIPVSRHCVLTLKSNEIVVDWGNGNCQEVLTGRISPLVEEEISHTTLDEELNHLKKVGLVEKFDVHNAYIVQMPEPPKPTIE